MATFFWRKLFADSRIHKWDRGIIPTLLLFELPLHTKTPLLTMQLYTKYWSYYNILYS